MWNFRPVRECRAEKYAKNENFHSFNKLINIKEKKDFGLYRYGKGLGRFRSKDFSSEIREKIQLNTTRLHISKLKS